MKTFYYVMRSANGGYWKNTRKNPTGYGHPNPYTPNLDEASQFASIIDLVHAFAAYAAHYSGENIRSSTTLWMWSCDARIVRVSVEEVVKLEVIETIMN